MLPSQVKALNNLVFGGKTLKEETKKKYLRELIIEIDATKRKEKLKALDNKIEANRLLDEELKEVTDKLSKLDRKYKRNNFIFFIVMSLVTGLLSIKMYFN